MLIDSFVVSSGWVFQRVLLLLFLLQVKQRVGLRRHDTSCVLVQEVLVEKDGGLGLSIDVAFF